MDPVPRLAMRSVTAVAAAALLSAAGCLAAATTASAASASTSAASTSTSAASASASAAASSSGTGLSVAGTLVDVTATSAGNAWAIGSTAKGPLILHWNGKAWSEVPAHAPAGTTLESVAATSADNAWAVGSIVSGSTRKGALILHWNGKAWSQVRSPAPAGAYLGGVAATSAGNAWAVGDYHETGGFKTLILRWNGKAWQQVPSPTPATGDEGAALSAVSAVSASDAWAAGAILSDTGPVEGLILRWNGRTWTVASGKAVASAANGFGSVAATSAANAWVGGCACAGGSDGIVTVHWNGSSWKLVPTPLPALGSAGGAVAAASATSAWAVGFTCGEACERGTAPSEPDILEWNGTTWKKTASPAPDGADLTAVAAVSASDAWVVGNTAGDNTIDTLILHWNGSSWT